MAGLLLKLLPPSILSGGATSTPRWSPRRRPPPTHRPTTTTTRITSSRINATESSSATTTPTPTSSTSSTTVKLTYLEFNGWLWELPGGLRVLVDPILVGNLDFGIPWLFDAAKKTLSSQSQPDGGLLAGAGCGVDLLLITQSLDDHCHLRTLTELAAVSPDLPVVATPNARPILSALPFTDVTYLEPGPSAAAAGGATVLATAGPVLGPPWQRPENGYIVTAGGKSVYYEPHCVYDAGFLRERALRADVLITPVVKQLLPADFTLVSGMEDAVELAVLLRPSYVVPMSNGEFDAKGLLAALVSTRGTVQAFRAMLADALPDAKVVEPTPGVPLHLRFFDDDDDDNNSSSSP